MWNIVITIVMKGDMSRRSILTGDALSISNMFLLHYIVWPSNKEYNANSLLLRLKCKQHKNRAICLSELIQSVSASNVHVPCMCQYQSSMRINENTLIIIVTDFWVRLHSIFLHVEDGFENINAIIFIKQCIFHVISGETKIPRNNYVIVGGDNGQLIKNCVCIRVKFNEELALGTINGILPSQRSPSIQQIAISKYPTIPQIAIANSLNTI